MRYTMPFGKHKGLPFEEVPGDYFDWLLRQDWLSARLRKQIEDYLENEEYEQYQSYRPPPPPPNGGPFKVGFTAEEQADLRAMLQAGFRALALKRHPDVGGNADAMKRLNLLADKLRKNGLMEEPK